VPRAREAGLIANCQMLMAQVRVAGSSTGKSACAAKSLIQTEISRRRDGPEESGSNKRDSPRDIRDIHIDRGQTLAVSLKGSSQQAFVASEESGKETTSFEEPRTEDRKIERDGVPERGAAQAES
jgi:hypothetical protein